MPKRVVRRWFTFADRHSQVILLVLSMALVLALIFAVLGWNKARNVENQLAAERLGKAIADVTTCFNQAQNRPRLIVILRGIAVELEPDPRQALGSLIEQYEMDTATVTECVDLARERGIDPTPYLNNPPSSAGTPQDPR